MPRRQRARSPLTQRAELDAAHTAVLEAEENIGGRWGGGSARRRLEEAQAAERAAARPARLRRLPRRRAHRRARRVRPTRPASLPSASSTRPRSPSRRWSAPVDQRAEVDHLRAERDRLLEQITDAPRASTPATPSSRLLRAHRPVARALRAPLDEALAGRRCCTPSASPWTRRRSRVPRGAPPPRLDEADDGTMDAGATQPRASAAPSWPRSRSAGRRSRMSCETAEAEVDRAAEALEVAERSVGAFESELTVRAGEDAQRLQRFAAAEQLRAQIEAVSGTLRRAEEDARAAVDARRPGSWPRPRRASSRPPTVVGDLARRARKLAEELPIDQRPEGDPLDTPAASWRTRLREHAEVLRPEIDRAEAAVAAASVQHGGGPGRAAARRRRQRGPAGRGPRRGPAAAPRASPSDTLLVLDEPFVGVDQTVRAELLEIVRTCSADRQIVLLTEDAEVLGWAIELPVDEAAAVPADALLARIQSPADTDLRPRAGARHGRPAAAGRHHHPPVPTDPTPPNPTPNPNLHRLPAVGPVSAEHRRPAVFRHDPHPNQARRGLGRADGRARRGRRVRGARLEGRGRPGQGAGRARRDLARTRQPRRAPAERAQPGRDRPDRSRRRPPSWPSPTTRRHGS